MKTKAEIINDITNSVLELAYTHFSHPDNVAKIYGAIREVEVEVGKRMEAVRSYEDGKSETIKARDRNIPA